MVPQTTGNYTNFLYGEVDGVTGFHKSSGNGTVAAGKAYLQLPTSEVSTARYVDIIFGDVTTGINEHSSLSTDHSVYDLQGREIVNRKYENRKYPKGVYIVGGKKAVK